MRGSFRDLTGLKFGKLSVIKKSDKSANHVVYWDCICDCGNEKVVKAFSLTGGLTKSCGCFTYEFIKKPHTETQICTKCEIEKPIENFSLYSSKRESRRAMCRDCVKIENKNYKEENKEMLKEKTKIFLENMPEEKKEVLKKKRSISHKKRKESMTAEEKAELKKYQKEYKQNNKEKRNKYEKDRRTNDPFYKLKDSIRILVIKSFHRKSIKKGKNTVNILGCSSLEFRDYIESKFESWMNWSNYGKFNGEFNFGWDLDHIVPMATAKTEEDVYKLNHYTNFQPLCSKINRHIKNDKINYELPKID